MARGRLRRVAAEPLPGCVRQRLCPVLLGTGVARVVRVHGAWEVQGCRARGQGVVARYELLLLPLVLGQGQLMAPQR